MNISTSTECQLINYKHIFKQHLEEYNVAFQWANAGYIEMKQRSIGTIVES